MNDNVMLGLKEGVRFCIVKDSEMTTHSTDEWQVGNVMVGLMEGATLWSV